MNLNIVCHEDELILSTGMKMGKEDSEREGRRGDLEQKLYYVHILLNMMHTEHTANI